MTVGVTAVLTEMVLKTIANYVYRYWYRVLICRPSLRRQLETQIAGALCSKLAQE